MKYKNCMENNKKNLYTDISSVLFFRGGGVGLGNFGRHFFMGFRCREELSFWVMF